MPQITSIAECQRLDDDTVVHAVKGIVKVIFKRRTGSSSKGAYSFEDFVLKSVNSKDEIVCTLKNREKLYPELEGKCIFIMSDQSSRGWVGVRTKDDQYEDKKTGETVTTRKLIITDKASIVQATEMDKPKTDDDEGEEADAGLAPAKRTAPAQRQTQPAAQMSPSEKAEHEYKMVKLHASRCGVMARIAWDSALHHMGEWMSGHQSQLAEIAADPAKILASTAMAIYISMDRMQMAGGVPHKVPETAAPQVLPVPAKVEPPADPEETEAAADDNAEDEIPF